MIAWILGRQASFRRASILYLRNAWQRPITTRLQRFSQAERSFPSLPPLDLAR